MHFWSKTEEYLFLHQSLQLGKFEGVDFKHDSIFIQISVQAYPNNYYSS